MCSSSRGSRRSVKQLGHPTDQPEAAIQPPQQQPSGIRCDDSAIEPGHNLVPFNRFKFEQCWATLCLHRGLSGIAVSDWRIAIFRDSPPRCIKGFEKSGLKLEYVYIPADGSTYFWREFQSRGINPLDYKGEPSRHDALNSEFPRNEWQSRPTYPDTFTNVRSGSLADIQRPPTRRPLSGAQQT